MAAIKKRMKTILSSRRGSSIVSVMAAFVLLLIGIAMFYTAVVASWNMANRAETMNLAAEQVLKQFYEGGYGQNLSVVSDTEILGEADSPVILLQEVDGTASLEIHASHEQVVLEAEVEQDGDLSKYPVKMYYFSD